MCAIQVIFSEWVPVHPNAFSLVHNSLHLHLIVFNKGDGVDRRVFIFLNCGDRNYIHAGHLTAQIVHFIRSRNHVREITLFDQLKSYCKDYKLH